MPYRDIIRQENKYLYQKVNNKLIADLFYEEIETYDLLSKKDKIGETTQLSSNSYVDVCERDYLEKVIKNYDDMRGIKLWSA